ncbi:hypothetical protein C414_000230096 [Campylobacter jejuni subsp. jejuni 414]|nr:hypothetical protein C414_000230096 [Campylobacter jejuni subsp. jejuni 414]
MDLIHNLPFLLFLFLILANFPYKSLAKKLIYFSYNKTF